MKRLALWISLTVAAVAIVVAYQLNSTGVGGKPGEENHAPPPSTSQTTSSTPTVSSPTSGARPSDTGKTGGTPDVHEGKPGENK